MKIALAPDGAELVWVDDGEGEPLLLIAGQATGMAGWGPTAQALAHHFRVIRYDQRGIGGSGQGSADRSRSSGDHRMDPPVHRRQSAPCAD
ncbi:alpha/beta fold hydrolase [Arthrobacter sp. ZGTC131]|uniref:alpha/beta fold hydrolase n=1 Tax=Arthrobacter sp. ZGTC131 TaxID=2058898 RepID=UPI0011B01A2A|nr:hypothetical protein [Arthrobacter sp. ZGTC131]